MKSCIFLNVTGIGISQDKFEQLDLLGGGKVQVSRDFRIITQPVNNTRGFGGGAIVTFI